MEETKKRPRITAPRRNSFERDNREEGRESGDSPRSYRSGPGSGTGRSYGERSYGARRSYSGRSGGGYADRRGGYSGSREGYSGGRQSGGGGYAGRRGSYSGSRESYSGGRESGRGYTDRRGSYAGSREGGRERREDGYSTSRSYSDYSDGRSYPDSGRPERSFRPRRPAGPRSGRPGGFSSSRPRTPYRKKESEGFSERGQAGINRMLSRKPKVEDTILPGYTTESPVQEVMRLNKFIANSGVCSRREADTFIQAGVVTVNGEVVTELGTKINVLNDDIRFNGERLKGEEKVYIVMNKPKGFVTTVSDPHADKSVIDLLRGCPMRVFPVGRLDKTTTGVLMFTNDGEMAEKLTHPSFNKKKIYQVSLDMDLRQEDMEKILAGVELNDGTVKADELEYVDAEDHRKLGIEIHSGKNRIVRRIFESLGYEVRGLDRVYFAGLTKKGLKKGAWRYLTENEVNVLKMGAYV